jgi:hypothetical protein
MTEVNAQPVEIAGQTQVNVVVFDADRKINKYPSPI